MKKTYVLLGIVTVSSIIGFINKDTIFQSYLQKQVNENLTVNSGIVSFCGNESMNNETSEQLIARVGDNTNARDSYREITNLIRKLVYSDTPETTALTEKISLWGWEDEEYIEEKLKEYKGRTSSYFKLRVKELLELKIYRKNAHFTEEELRQQRSDIYNSTYLANKEEINETISNTLSRLACESDEPSLFEEIPTFQKAFVPNLPEEQMDALKAQMKKRTEDNKSLASKPLEAFTQTYYQFINDVVAEFKVIDSTTTFEYKPDFELTQATNTLTVVSTNAFGKKTVMEVGCYGDITSTHPEFGTIQMVNCFIRKPENSGKSTYLSNDYIFGEDFDNKKVWNGLKKELMITFGS